MLKALILGGHGDIGKAIASKLASDGLTTVSVGHKDLDLANSSAVHLYFQNKPFDYDVIVYCVGLNTPGKIENITYNDFVKVMNVNTLSFIQIIQESLPYLRQKQFGRILAISSLYGSMAREHRSSYVASKHALVGAVKTMAIELAEFGIIINTLSPGFIDTKMTHSNNDSISISKLKSKIPMQRLGTPLEIAEVASFLCSTHNSYLTGQDIIVDGGYSAGGFNS